MPIDAPGVCGYARCNTSFDDAEAFVRHVAEDHIDDPRSEVFEAFQPSGSGAISSITFEAPMLMRLGISYAEAKNVTPADAAHGKLFSCSEVVATIRGMFITNPSDSPDMGRFMMDYLLWVLEHGSTNKTAGTGGFSVYYLQSSRPPNHMNWDSFFNRLFSYFKGRDAEVTPRTIQRSLDPVLWSTWNAGLPAIDEVKARGTARSNAFRDTNGSTVPPWAVVPYLFEEQRSSLSPEVVALINSYAKLDEGYSYPVSTVMDQSNRSIAKAATQIGFSSRIAGFLAPPKDQPEVISA